jgi:hypothetical protein
MNKKYFKSIVLSAFLLMGMVSFMFFTAESANAKTTITMCPGSGESCEVTFPDGDGNMHTVKSAKDKGADAVTVVVE